MEQLALSWDSHQKSICNGLSLLQQRGEFVDMTLAADGHHVKVHQMVLSLVSPYIKELISSAMCPHPVIFLNNISYTTLCAILEYIYTGEVLVTKDKLTELIAAGKALHIKGLRDMEEVETLEPTQSVTVSNIDPPSQKSISEKLRQIREKKKSIQPKQDNDPVLPLCKIYVDDTNDSTTDVEDVSTEAYTNNSNIDENTLNSPKKFGSETISADVTRNTIMNPKLQYTVSNQGGLQVIYNRFIYYLRYFGKKNRKRMWRCIDYSTGKKCPANICTDENNKVTTRSFTHNHPFHDNKIIKKLRLGIIYSIFKEAENKADDKKKNRQVPCSPLSDQLMSD